MTECSSITLVEVVSDHREHFRFAYGGRSEDEVVRDGVAPHRETDRLPKVDANDFQIGDFGFRNGGRLVQSPGGDCRLPPIDEIDRQSAVPGLGSFSFVTQLGRLYREPNSVYIVLEVDSAQFVARAFDRWYRYARTC